RRDAREPLGGSGMDIPIYQVDAFTDRPFRGNPAAVCPLERWLDDELLRAVAAENNLSETAYFVPIGDRYELRWFTPTVEVELCGHATLATAFVIFERLAPASTRLRFATRSSGVLEVLRQRDGSLTLDFPAQVAEPVDPPPELAAALGAV